MVDLALLQSISYIAGALGVCIAAFYNVMTLRVQQANMKNTLETRQAQILMSLYQKWSETEFQDAWRDISSVEYSDYDDYMAKYGRKSNPDCARKLSIVGTYFEGLGVMVKRGFIDATLVDDMMSLYIITYWQKLEPMFLEYRRRMQSPTTGEFAEYLYSVVYEIWRRQHPGISDPGRSSMATSPPNRD